ncbi:MAG TPA: NADH-quinone oxidoreductase subunit A [Fimbriimonadaceae bacterium]|nr:NADH-quinone oxidoreductase subunit A [Fimbriimonadaceae bacterium]
MTDPQATYVGSYIGILMLIGVAAVICGAMVTLSWVLGPKKVTPYKQSAYECGVAPSGNAKERFPIKFYLVAIVFILFDIEVVFLWSWMTVFAKSETPFVVMSGVSFLVYMATFIIGYLYVVRVGAIDWDETTTLAPEKLGLPVPNEVDEMETAALTNARGVA